MRAKHPIFVEAGDANVADAFLERDGGLVPLTLKREAADALAPPTRENPRLLSADDMGLVARIDAIQAIVSRAESVQRHVHPIAAQIDAVQRGAIASMFDRMADIVQPPPEPAGEGSPIGPKDDHVRSATLEELVRFNQIAQEFRLRRNAPGSAASVNNDEPTKASASCGCLRTE